MAAASAGTQAHPEIEHQLEAVNLRLARQADDAELLVQRGRLYIERADNRKALQDLAKASAIEPTLGEAWYWRAAAEMQLQQLDDATSSNQALIRLLRKNPGNHSALARGYFQCGDIMMAAGKPEQAASCFRQAVSLGKASPEQHIRLITSLRASAQPAAAIAAVEEAVRLHGELPQLLDIAIDIESERQHYREAIAWTDRALRQPHRRPWLLLRKAGLQQSLQEPAAAQQSLQAALDAINAMPPAKRHSQAVLELEQQIRQQQAK